jgi:hypothetical protein
VGEASGSGQNEVDREGHDERQTGSHFVQVQILTDSLRMTLHIIRHMISHVRVALNVTTYCPRELLLFSYLHHISGLWIFLGNKGRH